MTAPTCPDCGTALPADSPQSLCPALFVGISENGSDWTSESAEMGPSRRSVTLDLEHGVKATLLWNPNTGSVPGAGGQPLAEPRSNQIFLIVAGIVVLLLLIGGIVIIVRLARSGQSSGSKAAGIGCTVLLLGGLLLGLVPAALIVAYRATAIQTAQTMKQAAEMERIEAEADRSSPRARETPPAPEARPELAPSPAAAGR